MRIAAPLTRAQELSSHVVLFADVYINYNNLQVGIAVVRVFDKLGIPFTLTKVLDEGRSWQSQGLVEVAVKRLVIVGAYLEKLIDGNKEIIVAEPSVLSLFRYDYGKLINNDRLDDNNWCR